MNSDYYLPEDPLKRFQDIYDALNADRSWWDDASSLRFSAITALTCPGEPADIAGAIRDMADDLRREAGWFSSLPSQMRFVVGAMLVLHQDTAADFLREVDRVREWFRAVRLRRGYAYEMMSVLILRIQAEKQPIQQATVERLKAIYDQMKRYHWWLTGSDDLPACAILTGQKETPEHIGLAVEKIYRAIDERGFAKGNPLQTAANILYLAPLDSENIASRFADLANEFRAASVSIWQSDYDELAILSFLDHPALRIVDRVLQHRKAMEELRPRPDRSLTFNLASSITFLELFQLDQDLKTITDAKALLDMQAVINAQQAAIAASASVAATSAAASS